MLTNLTLENFKAFQKLDNLKIKPITILCGTNSCGKSSILQSILMLRQTLESKNLNQNLVLNGNLTNLGYFEDVIYKKNKDSKVKFSLDFNEKELENKVNQALKEVKLKDVIDWFGENLNLFEATKVGTITFEILAYFQNKANSKFPIIINEFNLRIGELPIEDKSSIFLYVRKVVEDYLAQYTYIGPLRGEPEREYIYRDKEIEIGNKGENAAYLYLSEREKEIQNHFFYNAGKEAFEKTENISLKDAVNQWLTLMKIENFDAEIINRIIYLSQNASKFDETKVGIADVGFGVSQIFPIVLEGLRMKNGGTLLLEQPEIHLHPNLQMQMADYFIALALSGKNVMAETHSDHIVNRLVRRIVEDETHKLKDLIAIYFIKPSENGAVYEEITIDEMKGVVNWPTDFFDQSATEQMKIMQAGLKKRKNQRVTPKS
jgi:predicted ATPase